jgi:hypothetical protein
VERQFLRESKLRIPRCQELQQPSTIVPTTRLFTLSRQSVLPPAWSLLATGFSRNNNVLGGLVGGLVGNDLLKSRQMSRVIVFL